MLCIYWLLEIIAHHRPYINLLYILMGRGMFMFLQISGKWAIACNLPVCGAQKLMPRKAAAKNTRTHSLPNESEQDEKRERTFSPMSKMKINQFNCNFVADSLSYSYLICTRTYVRHDFEFTNFNKCSMKKEKH